MFEDEVSIPDNPMDVQTLAAKIDAFTRTDTRTYTEDECLTMTVAIEAMRSKLDRFQAELLTTLDADGTTDARFGMRTASWLAREAGSARGPVAGRLRVGRALRSHFSQIDEAVREGRLSFDHAKALVDTSNPRTRDALSGAQDEIIALAEGATFDRWKNDIAALAEVADTDGAEPDPYEDLSLKMPITIDRTVHLDGTLDHASGAVFRQAINDKANELFRRFTRDAKHSDDLTVPARSTLRALALMELIREAIGAQAGSGSTPRAEITLVAHNHEVCDTDGIPLPRAAAGVWGCDPEIWGVVVDHMGIPVDVGRAKRLATVAQRHAIAIRDGGCTFPGCDAPIDWCDHHHVHAWDSGGPTDLNNIVALCRHHHGISHRTGWVMRLDDDQVPIWTSPSGDTITGQRHNRKKHQDRPAWPPGPGSGRPMSGRPASGTASRRPTASAPTAPVRPAERC